MKTLKDNQESREEIVKWCNGRVQEHLHGIDFPTNKGMEYLVIGETLIQTEKGFEVFDIKKVDNVQLDGLDHKDYPDYKV